MKRGHSKVSASKATMADGRSDTALVDLVRLIARQAAREWADRRAEDDQPTAATVWEQQS
jgi:hypothetical protein